MIISLWYLVIYLFLGFLARVAVQLCSNISDFVCICLQALPDILGPDVHVKNIRKIHLVQFDSEGVFGWIPTHTELISQFISGASNPV